jgi:hypothetical protein
VKLCTRTQHHNWFSQDREGQINPKLEQLRKRYVNPGPSPDASGVYMLPSAAGRPSPALAHPLKKTAEKAAKEEEEDEACAYDPVVILRSARLDDFSH